MAATVLEADATGRWTLTLQPVPRGAGHSSQKVAESACVGEFFHASGDCAAEAYLAFAKRVVQRYIDVAAMPGKKRKST